MEYVADFFKEHPQLHVKALASTTTPVETRSELVEDDADTVRRHDALALSWRPRWSIFPSFEGSVSVRPHAPGSIVALEGHYEPPGGWLGGIFDRAVGQTLANGTMDHLLNHLRRYTEARYRKFQRTLPTTEQLNESARVVRQEKRS